MAKYLGKPLTPEVAAAVEVEAFSVPETPIDPQQFEPQACGSVLFAVERFSHILDELHALHVEHYEQTERHRRHIPLDPDYDAVRAEDRAGTMVQITARQDGVLVGHLRLYIRRGRHTNTLHATEDALFLQERVRGGRTAYRMVQYSERVLKQLGVLEVRCTSKHVNSAARFMEGCGYVPVATELVKFLE